MDLLGRIGFEYKILYKYRYLRPESITVSKRNLQIKNVETIINKALLKRNINKRVKLVNNGSFYYKLAVHSI
jgi:hypothetical protein